MKRILHISFMVILVAGTFFLVSFTDQEHQRQTYKAFRIDVLNPSEMPLITAEEINERC